MIDSHQQPQLAIGDATSVCPACGARQTKGGRFCVQCRAVLIEFACPDCGAANPSGSRFCGECGRQLAAITPPGVGTWTHPTPSGPARARPGPSVYASVWRRALALILDSAIVLAAAIGPYALLTLFGSDFAASLFIWAGGSAYFWLTNSLEGLSGSGCSGCE